MNSNEKRKKEKRSERSIRECRVKAGGRLLKKATRASPAKYLRREREHSSNMESERVRKFVEKFEENSRRNIEAKLRRRDRSLTAEIIDGNSSNVLRRWSCKFWNCSISWKIRFGTHVLLPDANKKHSNCTLISSHFVKLGSTDVQLTNSMIDKHSVSSIIYSTCAM